MKTKIHNLTILGIFLISIIALFPSSASASTAVSGSILENTTWTAENSPYVVNGTLSIPAGMVLTIDSGVAVKFIHTQSKMDVYGTLQVNGTNDDNVYFTSYKDDEVGGDTNGDGSVTLPAAKDWRQVIVYPGANANFNYTIVRYGGMGAFNCPNYACLGAINNQGVLDFSNSQIYQTGKYGIYQSEGSANIYFSEFNGNTEKGIYVNSGNLSVANSFFSNQIHTSIMMSGNGNFGLNDNNFENNFRDVYVSATVNFTHSNNVSVSGNGRGFHISGSTGQKAVWTSDNMPYIIEGNLQVPAFSSLTIDSGTILKFSHNQSQMEVHGALNINGAKENKVYFTSLKDDEVGGDTNGDENETLPAVKDWRRILIIPRATAKIDNAVIKYGGYIQYNCPNYTCYGAINNRGNLNLTNSEITKNGNYGIYQTAGVSVIHNSSIFNHTNYGIFNYSTNVIDAINNWWGDKTGPYHLSLNTGGLGNAVSDNVAFDPWLNNEPNQIDPLILKYEPILYFHENERFFPMNVEAFVSNSSLWQLNGSHSLIKDESITIPVVLADLTPDGQDTINYYLQFSEGLIDKEPDPNKANTEYQELINNGETKNTYYGYKSEESYTDEEGNIHEFIVLQYWYFYAFNDWKYHGGLNNHEGDWEVVMIFLDKDTEEPKHAAYSSHHNEGRTITTGFQYDSVRRGWDSDEINKNNDQIISFVALGSHANYPNNNDGGKHKILLLYNDLTSYNGNHLYTENWREKFVFDENNFPLWLTNYKGLWGVNNIKDKGPQGPYYRTGEFGDQINLFYNPIEWAGINNVGKKDISEITKTVNFLKQGVKFVFDRTLELGTKIAVDLHNEIISFGNNVSDMVFSPHFWDIESSLENYTFGVEVSIHYDPDELSALGINENYLSTFYYNDITNVWETIPSIVDQTNLTVNFYTNHFSRYAIGMEKWRDITDNIKIKKNKRYYDPKTGIRNVSIEIKKEKDQHKAGNLRFLIENISEEGVELFNPTGFTNGETPYVEISGLDNQCLKAVDLEFGVPIEKINESRTLQNEVSTYVPELLKFDFDVKVMVEN